ncbi:unnamed protein product, partial [Porites lobata]
MVGSQLWSISYGVVLNYFYQHFDIIFLQASLIQVLQFLYLVKDFTPSIGHLNTVQILSTRAYAIVIISVIWTMNHLLSPTKRNRPKPTLDKNIAVRVCCCCFGVASLCNCRIFPAWQVNYTTIFLQYSNSFVNSIICAFKVPEFRQSSIMWCLRRRAINGVNTKNKKRRTDTVAFDLS